MPQVTFDIPVDVIDTLAISNGWTSQVDDGNGGMITNPVTKGQFAKKIATNLLKEEYKRLKTQSAVGEAAQTIETARLAAINEVNNVVIA
jgi:hypothetical protein